MAIVRVLYREPNPKTYEGIVLILNNGDKKLFNTEVCIELEDYKERL